MKKILTLLLSVAMIMTCTPTVFAGENAVVSSDTKAATSSVENREEEKTSNESSEKEGNLQEEEAAFTTLSKEEEENELKVTGTGNVCKIGDTEYATVQKAIDAAGTKATTIKMIADSTESILIKSNFDEDPATEDPQEITLDLNGHILKGEAEDEESSIEVEGSTEGSAGKLAIIDSDSSAEHYFTYARTAKWELKGSTDESEKEGAISVDDITNETAEGAVIKVFGGIITGGDSQRAVGIDVGKNAFLTMSAGNVVGNSGETGGGGGVRNIGTFTMSGGAIIGNTSNSFSGGGVNNGGSGSFKFTNGLIAYNTTGSYGAGVANESGGKFDMSGGKIIGNIATKGNGAGVGNLGTFTMSEGKISGNILSRSIFSQNGSGVDNESEFTMTGGKITGNTNSSRGSSAGVYNNDTMTVGGTAVIKNNKKGTAENNLYLPKDKIITIGTKTGDTGETKGNGVTALADGASIGVTMRDGTGQFTNNGTETDEQYFFSDNAAYMVDFNNSNTEKTDDDYLELTEKKVCRIGSTKYETIAAALAASHQDEDKSNPTTITMIADDEEVVTINSGRYITLDLNGHVLQGKAGESVVYVAGESEIGKRNANNKLTIIDSNKSAKHYFKYSSTGAWTLDTTASSGIAVSDITSSTAENTAIEIKGGVITGGAKSGGYGGGVSVGISSELVMTGGTICGNTAKQGGGMYTGNAVKVTLRDATIVGNHAADGDYDFGGALLNANGSTFTFGGVVKIFANSAPHYNNLTLWDAKTGAPITIDENNKLADGSRILVQFGYYPNPGVGAFTTNGTADDANYFTSDNPDYRVKFVEETAKAAAHLELSNHIHSWKYSEGGTDNKDTLKAYCTAAGCDGTAVSEETAEKLIIKAPESNKLTYDGTAKAASLVGADGQSKASLGGVTNLTINYQKKTDENTYEAATTTAPTAAGTYKASVTVDTDKTAFVEYAIAKAEVELSNVSATGVTYGQALNSSTISGTARYKDSDIAGTWSWKDGTAKPAVADSNKTEYNAVFTPDAAQYPNLKETEAKVKLTVSKAKVKVPEGQNYTYDGTEKTGVSESTLYALTDNKKTGAGSYTATAALNDKDNYEWDTTSVTTDDQSVNWAISPVQLVVTGTVADGKTYDGKTTADAHIGEVSGIVEKDKVEVKISSATFDNKNAGNGKTVTIKYAISGNDKDNYIAPSDLAATADIEKKPVNVTAENKTSYVGSELETLTYTADELCEGDAWTGALETNANKDIVAADYTITRGTLKIEDGNGGKNYTISFTPGTYTVTAKEIQTLKFEGVSEGKVTKTYGDADFTEAVSGAKTTVTYSSIDESVATVDANGKVTIRKAGSTVIKATAAETAMYAEGEAQYTLTVNKIRVDIPQAVTGLVYNGNEQTGVVLPEDAKYELSDNKAKDAGSHTATAKLSDKDNYAWDKATPEDADQSIPWAIAGKPVTVTGTSVKASKEYDGTPDAEITSKGALEGIVGSDNVELDSVTAAYDDPNCGDNKPVTVTYTIMGDDSGNYLAPASKTLTAAITKAEVTLSNVSAKEVTYGQALSSSTISGTARFKGSDITGTWSWTDGTVKPAVSDSNNTEYTVVFTPDATQHPNLRKTEAKVKLTVNKAKVTVTAEDKSIILGSNVPTLTAKVEGLIGEDTLDISFKDIEKPAFQGVYSIVPYVKEQSGNYDVICKQGKLTVTKPGSNVVVNPENLSNVLDNYREDKEYAGKTLDVEVKTDGEVPQSDKDLITKKAGANKKIVFYDTDLLLITRTEDESGIKTETRDIGDENDTLIAVTYKFDFSNKKNIQVFRAHTDAQGKTGVDELTATPNANGEYAESNEKEGTVTTYSIKYSTYAFAYDEVKGSGTDKSSSDKGTSTGDSVNLTAAMLLLVLAMAGAAAALIARRREH